MIKERRIFEVLLKENLNKKISILLGPRQVGKTTALKYLFDNLCTKQNNKGLFLDIDIFSNFEKISTYENAINTFKLAGYSLDQKETFFVFLDEFQRYNDITIILKNIYDHHKNIKLYITGSSSLAIKHTIQETLAGRKKIITMFPLCFEEFLLFKEKHALFDELNNVVSLKGTNLIKPTRELFINFEEFLIFGGYPEVVLSHNQEEKQELLNSIFDLYVKKELVEYLKIDKIHETKKLVEYLAVNNGQKIKYQNIAQFIHFSQKTVKNYIELLKETFLIAELKPFFTNKNKELVKIPKIYFLDSGVANFFTNNFNKLSIRKDAPFLFENFILSELIKKGVKTDTLKFWQDKNAYEVDFIIEEGEKITAIEVKFKQTLKSSDFTTLQIFQKHYPGAHSYLVNLSRQETVKGITILLPYSIKQVL